MLVQLSIRDIVLIERLDLDFESGLSVLTGETGAGKSILLDSLSLALGGRGDGGLVRHGEEKGQVTAVFDVEGRHAARQLLRENGIDDDGDLIFRRIQNPDGRTRASINDQPVSVQLMRQIGQLLVEIHGQHDDRALTDTNTHRNLLDAFAGLAGEAQQVGDLYRSWKDAERAFKTHRARVEAAAREADYIRASMEELEALSPRDGEEDELAERRSQMQKAERIAGDISEASDFLNGNVFDISTGSSGLEPVQLAVRALVERASVEFMANLYGAPGPEICLSPENDPLGATTIGATGGYYPTYPNTDTNNGQTRADPSRWHDRRDSVLRRAGQ